MGLVKRTYTDGETVITAENLNDIQDAIIQNEDTLANLNAGNVAFNKESGYVSGTVGRYLKLLDSEDVQYTYGGEKELGTVGETLDYIVDNIAEIGEDVDDLEDAASELRNTLSHKADVIYDTASGDIASFPDGADGLPVKDLTVGIEPVQDMHGYDNPWPAGGGANRFDEVWESGSLNGNTGEPTPATAWSRSTDFIPVQAETQYYINVAGASSTEYFYLFYYKSDKTYIPPAVYGEANRIVTTPAECAYMKIEYKRPIADMVNYKAAINYPATVTTYSPYSNICPISGWTGANVSRTGKNLLPNNSAQSGSSSGVTYVKNSDGSITLNGTATNNFNIPLYGTSDTDLKPFPYSDKPITLSGCPVGGSTSTFRMGGYLYKDGVYSGYGIIDTGSSKTVSGVDFNQIYFIIFGYSGYTFNNLTFYPMIEYGTAPTSYEPYRGATIPISWQSSAGTVYGGTLDVTTGVLTVDSVGENMGAIRWSYVNQEFHIFQYKPASFSPGKYLCSCYNIVPQVMHSQQPDRTIQIRNDGTIYIKDSLFDSVSDLQTALAGQILVYPLATHVTYQLTLTEVTTLLGQNNVWADTGAVLNCEYPCDTKLYIQKINAPSDDDMIADANIASGVYFIVNNNLYFSTASILAGDPIKPGTNCTLTNLAAALNAINS